MLLSFEVPHFRLVILVASAVGGAVAGMERLETHAQEAPQRQELVYAPAPVDNPLKGLVPYQGDVRRDFPHSLEFNYVFFHQLVKGYAEFDWKPLEQMLDDIASRGHQAVVRIALEYPGRTGLIPDFLIRDGLKVTRWRFQESADRPGQWVETPDYENPRLRRCLRELIHALGKKYDGDPRLGFITAGLLGLWGEWHTWPRSELFASKTVQQEVMDAYEAAFKTTPILLRYPANDNHPTLAANAHRRFGYHDDSFAWATLPTGRKEDAWFFLSALKAAGPSAEAKWQTHPIGGEIRPEAWGRVFDDDPGDPRIQNFRRCVEATHASWLMDSGMFRRKVPPARRQKALQEVRRLGYEFHVSAVTVPTQAHGSLPVELELVNRGVAPFYYDWKAQWGLLVNGKAIHTWPSQGKLTGLLPGDPPRRWRERLDISAVTPGRYVLAVRVPHPLPQGAPLRFANATQDTDAPGWLSLGQIQIR